MNTKNIIEITKEIAYAEGTLDKSVVSKKDIDDAIKDINNGYLKIIAILEATIQDLASLPHMPVHKIAIKDTYFVDEGLVRLNTLEDILLQLFEKSQRHFTHIIVSRNTWLKLEREVQPHNIYSRFTLKAEFSEAPMKGALLLNIGITQGD